MISNTIQIFTTGTSSTQTNVAGWCYYIPEIQSGAYNKVFNCTKNQVNLIAIIEALKYVITQTTFKNVQLYTDSKYCLDIFYGYKNPHTNKDLLDTIKNIVCENCLSVEYCYIDRRDNSVCTRMAQLALSQQ